MQCKIYIGGLVCGFFLAITSTYAEEASQESNQEVLDAWEETSGQKGMISDESGGEIEWHGQVTEDVYHVDVESAQQNNTLSGLDEGNFSTTRLQGDLRYNQNDGDINYIQGGISVSNDEALQSLYRSQITNVQFGRAGSNYQLAAGDVVADFSKIGSSLGLRGAYATKQNNAFTVSGFAGTIANSWESLFNRSTITHQPARTQYLRDVIGAKLNYDIDGGWSAFGTAQTYSDRQSSLNSMLSGSAFSENGTTGTAGVAYQDERASFSVELGVSQLTYDSDLADDASDSAFLIDAAYSWDKVNVQLGYHDLGTRYTSLSQNVLPGVREAFLSGQWFITPNLTYGGDLRQSDSRFTNVFGDESPVNSVYSMTNWFTYSVEQLPGLSLSLQDSRNWAEIDNLDIKSRNTSTQFSTSYATQHYSSSIAFSNLRERDSASSLSDSTTDGVQLTVGRQILHGELLALPSLSGSVQLTGGYQQQRINNGTETSSGNQGVSFGINSKSMGQIQASLTNMDTRQPTDGTMLNTKSIYLDWSKMVMDALALKVYVSNNYINHGDKTKRVDEKTMGLQADYQW